jgi:5-methyltetrahydropteroyltriglutamate--homocysteine methyltransferase
MKTYAYGFPRLGKDRRYKKNIEDFWKNKISEKRLITELEDIEKERLKIYKKYVDLYPASEITPYDHILDTAFMLGVYKYKNLKEYYQHTRGKHALVMKKYFSTNYHYLVPQIGKNTKFSVKWNKPLAYYSAEKPKNVKTVFCIGPFTFLKLSKTEKGFDLALQELSCAYKKLFQKLAESDVEAIHIEEPAFATDCSEKEIDAICKAYEEILSINIKTNLITYYESVSFLKRLYDLKFDAISLDFIAGEENIDLIKKIGFPKDKRLICGIIDGRIPVRANILEKAKQIEKIKRITGLDQDNILISNNCPLIPLYADSHIGFVF